MNELLPSVPDKEHAFVAAVVVTTMSAIGKAVSQEALSGSEVEAWASAVGGMLCEYLCHLSMGRDSGETL
jgi:hypothetical protein